MSVIQIALPEKAVLDVYSQTQAAERGKESTKTYVT